MIRDQYYVMQGYGQANRIADLPVFTVDGQPRQHWVLDIAILAQSKCKAPKCILPLRNGVV